MFSTLGMSTFDFLSVNVALCRVVKFRFPTWRCVLFVSGTVARVLGHPRRLVISLLRINDIGQVYFERLRRVGGKGITKFNGGDQTCYVGSAVDLYYYGFRGPLILRTIRRILI